ncbi:probable LRR receptor-like serine/threonine-protein kinase At3g47570 isoform X1 [Amborella trichopoda]|uniref:non-specific serine/threonine protein kinase n=1 Tax=Amborella trichopoda TaxID=13333 RepID=W1PNX7_AMBTC|nr:probable LRR receptor-like serine/threonine-protein kinase At3g47570 isoform X1 [Amborella trichopoda]ERN09758.1 hypothetical protein AMTR_s00029p00235900 [Amborella trichopoda]|eukprot:XP_020525043.1 probable LRR receptor-like serine/threonine-protein kinase At3g47570 isoform X1 [Amborella trichopoda]
MNQASAMLVFSLLLINLFTFTISHSTPSLSLNSTDQQALFSFKTHITQDPNRALDSWNHTISLCNWKGVLCDPITQRVRALDLHDLSLQGTITPQIGNLSSLETLFLQENNLQGSLPLEIGSLFELQTLNLSFNSLSGNIPASITKCSKLRVLNLHENQFRGSFPSEFDQLKDLEFLSIYNNRLTGNIPPSLGNLTSLTFLSLSRNRFYGTIPESLGKLKKLWKLQLCGNNLTGTVPPSLYNISSLLYFSLTNNKIQGSLPHDMGFKLPNLQELLFGGNRFHGVFPVSLTNATGFRVLDLSANNLVGPLPLMFGNWPNLTRLNLERNGFSSSEEKGLSFIDSLSNCTKLEILSVFSNRLTGILPGSVSSLSTQLSQFLMGDNHISGSLPTDLDKLINLKSLDLSSNLLSGTIPTSIGSLKNLQILFLNKNQFSGEIPCSIGEITGLTKLDLSNNRLSGRIPKNLGRYRNIMILSLSANELNGTIPEEIFSLSSLAEALNLSSNSLSGILPLQFGNLNMVQAIDLSRNRISGRIPDTIGNCVGLQSLDLHGNSFEGPIPDSMTKLTGLTELDLSSNHLSGRIPEPLQELQFLRSLNLSYNNLEGEIPEGGSFKNLNSTSFLGNSRLCVVRERENLPLCSGSRAPKNDEKRVGLTESILIICSPVVAVIIFVTVYLFVRKESSKVSSEPDLMEEDYQRKISYEELYTATDAFSESRLMGIGNFGSVYEGILNDGLKVAVKVLNLRRHGAFKSFIVECETLRNVRHRNLVKIITSCSSIDFRSNEFKALVFELMSNGSLENWLHPFEGSSERSQLMSCNNSMSSSEGIRTCNPSVNSSERIHEHTSNQLMVISEMNYKCISDPSPMSSKERIQRNASNSFMGCRERIQENILNQSLSLNQRLNIVMDVASAMDYLHNDCQNPIIHCDLKPSNVLLDDSMNAHVADFGLSRFLPAPDLRTSTLGLKGSVGYIPPEYGLGGEVSTAGDVYSYGILLLEIFTGKRPTDNMFTDGLNLPNFVSLKFPDQIMEIIDSRLVEEVGGRKSTGDGRTMSKKRKWEQSLVSLIRIGLMCAKENSKERMNMREVVKELRKVKVMGDI